MRSGDREGALMTFMSEIVLISADEVAAMKARPSWAGLLATVETSVRQDRALSQYQFEAARARTIPVPTLLMAGEQDRFARTQTIDRQPAPDIAASHVAHL